MKAFLRTLALSALVFFGTAFAQGQVTLGYVLWDSEIASTTVLATVLEDEGYEVEMIAVDAGPMWTGVARGDFDAIVAAWLPVTHETYWNEYQDSLVDFGANLHGADIGWVVPAYVTIESIEELNDHAAEFEYRIIGIAPGAGLMSASEAAVEEYALELDLIDGSDAAMAAALDRAVNRDEWVVVTGWRPHWKWAAYDLKYLEDPKGVFGGSEDIHTILNAEFAANADEKLLSILDNFHWSGEDMGAVMLDIIENDTDPVDAARAWVDANQDLVNEWVQ